MNVCPVCGGDRNADLSKAREQLHQLKVSYESPNPGGRVIEFMDGRSLQIHDQCNACDAAKIDEFYRNSTGDLLP